MKEKKTLLIIPYLRAAAQGGELETAVNGWLKNFKGDLQIAIIGDESPVVKKLVTQQKVVFLPSERDPKHAKEPALDIARKMRYAMSFFANNPLADNFSGCIWSNDDIYPVNPVTLKDIKALKWIRTEMTGNPESANYFQRSMYRSAVALREAGKPAHNHCTHLPNWFDFGRLKEVLDAYDCDNTPHLIGCLYYNHWYTSPKAVRIDVSKPGNRYKVGVYTRNYDLDSLRKQIEAGTLFVNNSSAGYSKELILAVRKYI